MSLTDLLILTAATLYLAEVISSKSGPGNIFGWLRERAPLGGLTACVWCLAPWIALILMLVYLFVPYGIYGVQVLAIAGAALMLRSYTGVHHG